MLVIGKTIMSHLACLSLCFGYRQYLDRDITNIICKLCQKFRSVCSGFLTSWFVNFWDKLRENSLHSRTKVKLLNQSLCHGNLEKATRVLKIGSQRVNSRMFLKLPLHNDYSKINFPFPMLFLLTWKEKMSKLTNLLRNALFPSSSGAKY